MTGSSVLASRRRAGRLGLALLGAACFAIYATEVFVARRIAGSPYPDALGAAVVLDLVVFVPALVWLTVGRRRGWSPMRIVPIVFLGLIMASWLVPEPHRGAVDAAHLLVVPLELIFIGWVGWRATAALRGARRDMRVGYADPLEALARAAADLVGHRGAGRVMGYEIGVLAYALGLASTERPLDGTRHFTHHRRTAYTAVAAVVLMAAVVETAGLHLLVQLWSPVAAWALTALGLYALLWVVADLRALSRRPSRTSAQGLQLRVGLRWTMRIPWTGVARVERATETSPRSKTTLRTMVLGSPTHRIRLVEPLVAAGPYGIARRVEAVELAVDDTREFDVEVAAHAPWTVDEAGADRRKPAKCQDSTAPTGSDMGT